MPDDRANDLLVAAGEARQLLDRHVEPRRLAAGHRRCAWGAGDRSLARGAGRACRGAGDPPLARGAGDRPLARGAGRAREGAGDRLERRLLDRRALDEEDVQALVARRREQHAAGRLAVAPRTAGLLVVGLDRTWDRLVADRP